MGLGKGWGWAAFSPLAGSIFGGNKREATPQQEQSGYYALPPNIRAAYDQYYSQFSKFASNPNDPSRFRQVGAPQSPFDSQELYNLQKTMPNRGAEAIGVLEPFNDIEKSAYSQLANPDYSAEGLAQYFNPYHEAVTNQALDQVNRVGDVNRRGINDRFQQLGGRRGIRSNSALQTQLAQNEEDRARVLGEVAGRYGERGFENAVGLKNQSLAQMLGAGGNIREQNQARLNASNSPQSNPMYAQLQALMGLLQGANPGASNSVGAQGAMPNNSTTFSNLLMGLFGNYAGGKGGAGAGGMNGGFGR